MKLIKAGKDTGSMTKRKLTIELTEMEFHDLHSCIMLDEIRKLHKKDSPKFIRAAERLHKNFWAICKKL